MTIEKMKKKKFPNLFALWFLTNPPNFNVPNFETFRCRQLNVVFVCGACLRALPNAVLGVEPQSPIFELATHAEATRETIEEWITVKIISLHPRQKKKLTHSALSAGEGSNIDNDHCNLLLEKRAFVDAM